MNSMSGKYKMTGCARFFLVLLVLIPVAYVVASFITGDNGMDFINDIFGKKSDDKTEILEDTPLTPSEDPSQEVYDLEKELDKKNLEIKSLKEENARLKSTLDRLLQEN